MLTVVIVHVDMLSVIMLNVIVLLNELAQVYKMKIINYIIVSFALVLKLVPTFSNFHDS
jgi:hypothetical protein